MRLVIGYDGSAGADAALDDLTRMGLPTPIEVLLVMVTEVWMPPLSGLDSTDVEGVSERADLNRQSLGRVLDRLRSDPRVLPGLSVETLIESGSPAGTLLNRAAEWGADMILVGSHGASHFERLYPGSVSQRVATDAKCSVRIARGRLEEVAGQPLRLVIGVDGSIDSDSAVFVVASRHWPVGTEVRLVTSIGPFSGGHHVTTIDQQRALITKMQTQAADRLRQASGGRLMVTSVISLEDPKHALVGEADAWGADAIFVGSRGQSRLGRFFLGSVAAAVAARAHCSVEVVRRVATALDEIPDGTQAASEESR